MSRELDEPPVPVTFKRRRIAAADPSPAVQTKKPQSLKKMNKNEPDRLLKVTRENSTEFWHCPICGKNFTSVGAKKIHIKVHGEEVVARALADKNKQLTQVSKKTKATQYPGRKMRKVLAAASKKASATRELNIKNACRVCGVTPAMPGDDVCYSCHSK